MTKPSTQLPLPTELLLNIFHLIKDKKHLASCRLVCAGWKPLVDMAMYKELNLVDLRYEKTARHLEKRPDLCLYIQRISNMHQAKSSLELERLLQVAMTPNLRVLDGYWSERDIAAVKSIIKRSADKFIKLEELPHVMDCSKVCVRLMKLCVRSLQTLSWDITPKTSPVDMVLLGSMMSQFKNLTRLTITSRRGIQTMVDLEGLLENCRHLKRLGLAIDEPTVYTRLQEEELTEWLSNNVKKVHSLEQLEILPRGYVTFVQLLARRNVTTSNNNFFDDWIQYLNYKYPNISTLRLDNQTNVHTDKPLPNFTNLTAYDLTHCAFFDVGALQSFINRFKRPSNLVTLQYGGGRPFLQNAICTMSTQGKRDSIKADFGISLRVEAEDVLAAKLESILGSLHVDHLTIESIPSVSSMPIFSFLVHTPLVKTLTIRQADIGIKLTDVVNVAMLDTVKLCDIDMTPEMMMLLGQSVPSMKSLTLSNCNFQYRVNAPFNHLDKLTIQQNSRLKARFAMMRGNVYIDITHVVIQKQVFLLARAGKHPTEITLKEFEMFSDEFSRIHIVCNSLKQLEMNLGAVNFKVAFDENGKIKE